MTKFMSRIVSGGALAAIMASLFAGPEAQAIKDPRARYAQLKTGRLILGPAEFTPYRQTAAYSRSTFALAAGSNDLLAAGSNDLVCLHAPVRLPHAATITQLRVLYSRPAEADSMLTRLHQVSVSGPNVGLVASDGANAPLTKRGSITYAADPALSIVDTQEYYYDLEVCLANDAAFFNAGIEFTQPAADTSAPAPPRPAHAGALTGLEHAAKGGVAGLCMAPAAEAYSHVGIADEAIMPFASCLR